MDEFANIGFMPADILLPKMGDITKWSVVACDQYTSQPEYWQEVARITDGEISTLDIIFPEVYLENGDEKATIEKINSKMQEYINNDIFQKHEDSFVYVERTFPNGKKRCGIVGAIDLESYDYSDNAKSAIRATEKTVVERLPARVDIRCNAPLELPHVMLLVDDPADSVIAPLRENSEKYELLYDFELMQNGGHIKGYLIPREQAGGIADALDAIQNDNEFLFAVGDGNHSLAAAKNIWESAKKNLSELEFETHPARFALVEVCNIHEDSLEFEPIHRIVFDCEPQEVIDGLKKYLAGKEKAQKISFVHAGGEGEIEFPSGYPLALLQNYLDDNDHKIDYIHGDDVARELAKKSNHLAFLLPPMSKDQLFSDVATSGALLRKTFSIGEAHEKRFYLECRKIK